MEPTRSALSELSKLLGEPTDVSRHPYWTVHAVRSIAIEVAIILALAMGIGAFLALVVWLWITVL